MNKVNCYFVGHIPRGSKEIVLVKPIRRHNMGFSFTETLGEFFFEFAEKHFHCEPGEDIVLIATSIERDQLDSQYFIEQLHNKFVGFTNQKGTIIRRRTAVAKDSIELSKRVHQDLHKTHRLIMEGRSPL